VCRFRRPKFQPRQPYQQLQDTAAHKDKKQKTSHTAGRIDPHPDLTLAKYSTETSHLTKFLKLLNLNEPVHESPLTNAAYAKSTWAKHCTSINSYHDYADENGIPYRFPLELDDLIGYIEWAVFERNLSASSVKSYVSSLSTTHHLINMKSEIFDNPIIKLMLKGAENTCKSTMKPSRKVVTIPILKLIGHEIAGLNWSSYSKQVYWATCCTSFFGSTRMGELLAENESKFDPTTTLSWNDIEFFENDRILIHLKNPKIRSKEGQYVDLYSYGNSSFCPMSSLTILKHMTIEKELWKKENPVFCFENGKNLTIKSFNEILQKLLYPHMGERAFEYSCHSFRPSLPSYMAMYPEFISKDDIKSQGRWKSSTFEIYTRLKRAEKRKLFEKIMKALE